VEREVYISAASVRLSISTEVLANDVKRYRARMAREQRQKESRDLQMSARNFGDRVNPDAAKDPAAANAEDTVLGLMLLLPEHRAALASGRVALSAEDFFTEFGRRAFSAIIELEASGGFIYSLLGENFNPDEMSALEDMQLRRRTLAENGPEVFRSSAQILRSETKKAADVQSGNYTLEDKLAEKRRRLEELRKNRGE
jgi:hypothetical protein